MRALAKFASLCAVLFASALTGCAVMGDVVSSKGKGTAVEYDVTQEAAWEISREILRQEGTEAIEEHRDEGYMLTSSGMNFVSYGTLIGVWVEPGRQKATLVTVVTKRRIATNVFTTLTEGTFHRMFASRAAGRRSSGP